MAEEKATPQEQVRRLYEDAEARTASAMEELVGRNSFGELLARMTENAMALTRIGGDVLDLTVRNLRLAGRQDVTRLARQLARTEDKLETVLQEVERLQERLDAQDGTTSRATGTSASSRRSSESRARSRSGSNSSGGGRSRSRKSGS
jgi:uncharacterized membrane protein YgcG